MYGISDYGDMVADRVRMDAYAEAIRRVVAPGSVVLDLGAGTGIFSLLACRSGARRVYALDTSDALMLTREAARLNGSADQVVLIEGESTRVELPERVDVIVSDLRGRLPFFGRHLPDVMDARQRFLAAGGRMIPRADRVFVAVVEAPDLLRKYREPWEANSLGLDLSSALRFVNQTCFRGRFAAEQLLSRPQLWADLPYETMNSPHGDGRIVAPIVRAGTGHGLAVWFDADLADGVGFSNAPGAPPCLYAQSIFPWPEPVPLQLGDVVEVRLQARLIHDDYVWCWDTEVRGADGQGSVRFQARQSTFHGTPLSPERLARNASGHVPRLNEEGRIALLVLESMREGSTSLGDLARSLTAQFPDRVSDWHDALKFAGDLANRYSH